MRFPRRQRRPEEQPRTLTLEECRSRLVSLKEELTGDPYLDDRQKASLWIEAVELYYAAYLASLGRRP